MSAQQYQDGIILDVVEALAEADRLDLEEVEYTLYEYINPEVLTQLADDRGSTWEFTFEVADHEVTITSDGRLFVDGILCRTDLTLNRFSSGCAYS
ncbi:HalOD1 output domain-containing protein [Natronorubrum halophilum]|uniref:HalOD1 output domain-containing protein n=1 Tax=Natronorubrum halophilum TaxID=1702106 RepID=UPI000EF6DADE|nr:HalOD1 output domain-containing protein [Natronorubrum halophilum]